MQLRRLALAVAVILLAVMAAGGDALAYPQFQLSTGNGRCNMCHISPAGGGLINSYGRVESSATISQFGTDGEGLGNGDFMYGLYEEPEWMQLGLDFRAMFLARERAADPEYYVFPMQGDTYANFKAGDFSFYTVIGPRAQVRTPRASVLNRFGSREYWVMWQPKVRGYYARAGRFMAPYGLRSQDHTMYVRRYLGYHSWEETYNLSGGRVENDWETHLTAFMRVPDILQGNGPRRSGATLYYERRLGEDENIVVGTQGRAGFGSVDRHYMLGGIGKYYFDSANVLLMAEANFAYQDFTFGARGRPQWAGYLGASYWPFQGLMLGAGLEQFDEDMTVSDVARNAAQLTVQYFPLAHWEIMLIGKHESNADLSDNAHTFMLQLHYYL